MNPQQETRIAIISRNSWTWIGSWAPSGPRTSRIFTSGSSGSPSLCFSTWIFQTQLGHSIPWKHSQGSWTEITKISLVHGLKSLKSRILIRQVFTWLTNNQQFEIVIYAYILSEWKKELQQHIHLYSMTWLSFIGFKNFVVILF